MDSVRRKSIHDAMVRLSDGDRGAFQILLDELWPVLFAFVRRGVGHEQDAEDVAQEVFLRLCSRISDFDRERDGLSWAFGIAAYEIMTHRRRTRRRQEAFDVAELGEHAAPLASQEEATIQGELLAALAQATGMLSTEDRSTLGLAPELVAIDLPSPTLRKRRQRALDRLRIVWRKLYGQP